MPNDLTQALSIIVIVELILLALITRYYQQDQHMTYDARPNTGLDMESDMVESLDGGNYLRDEDEEIEEMDEDEPHWAGDRAEKRYGLQIKGTDVPWKGYSHHQSYTSKGAARADMRREAARLGIKGYRIIDYQENSIVEQSDIDYGGHR